MKHYYECHYKNIIVRPLESNDIEILRRWRNDPSNTRYLRDVGYISYKQQLRWFIKYIQNEDEICFAIEERFLLGRLIGSASLYHFNGSVAEFGKILIGDTEAHGIKAAYNAIICILKIAFNDLFLSRVVLHCYKENTVAFHIYNQIGFTIYKENKTKLGIEYFMAISKEKWENYHV